MGVKANRPLILALRGLRKMHDRFVPGSAGAGPACDRDPDSVSRLIRGMIEASRPAMLARFGSNELACVVNHLGVHADRHDVIGYIRGRSPPWWWNERIIEQMGACAGFFPTDVPAVERFCMLMLAESPLVDVLGSWRPEEQWLSPWLTGARRVQLRYFDPFHAQTPWTLALTGRRVLVVHPFEKTIRAQYARRARIFPSGLLPDFTLLTIPAVQSSALERVEFPDWFAALDSMKRAMDREDYDVALIGCGAYGFPLAAHAKRQGKIGFHIGGSLQLLFGILGKRWEGAAFVNEHWVRPAPEETPRQARVVENACYW